MFVQSIWDYVYTSTIDPDDNFRTRTRKAVVAVGALFTIPALFNALQLIFRLINGWDILLFNPAVVSTIHVLVFVAAWAHQKRTRYVSNRVMMLWHVGIWLLLTFHTLGNVERQFHVLSTLFVIVAVVLDSHVQLNYYMWLILITVNAYNLTFGAYTDWPYLGVPQQQTISGSITVQIAAIVAFFLIVKLVKVQTKEYVRMLARADK
eukprot:PhM_4_TR2077/c2_g1_i14/m.6871